MTIYVKWIRIHCESYI